jgi:hypothetical protein
MNTETKPERDLLAEDLAEDIAKLVAWFQHAGIYRYISDDSLAVMGLHLTGPALVNLGVLVPIRSGRWCDNYVPGPIINMQFIETRNSKLETQN